MKVLIVLAFLNFIIWVYFGLLLFISLKKKPIFYGSDRAVNEITYPSLSIIIPACNEEEAIDQAVSRLLDQDYPDFEVIAVNDRSTDSTGAILEELNVKYPQLKVINITDLPPQWLGKNHAIYQGVKHAQGEWLLFTDADIIYSPGSLKKTVSYALHNKLDHLTINPDVISNGFFHSGFISFFLFVVTFLFVVSKSAGIGAFNLIKRSAYQEIGGYEAIALQPVDDYSLGKLVVKKGFKQCFGYSRGLITVKLYNNLSASIKGIEKNQFAGTNYNVIGTLAYCSLILFLHVYPFVGLFFGSVWARAMCGLTIVNIAAFYNFSKKYLDISLKHFIIHPISASLYTWAVFNSMIKILKRDGIEWRGTIYPLEELRKHPM